MKNEDLSPEKDFQKKSSNLPEKRGGEKSSNYQSIKFKPTPKPTGVRVEEDKDAPVLQVNPELDWGADDEIKTKLPSKSILWFAVSFVLVISLMILSYFLYTEDSNKEVVKSPIIIQQEAPVPDIIENSDKYMPMGIKLINAISDEKTPIESWAANLPSFEQQQISEWKSSDAAWEKLREYPHEWRWSTLMNPHPSLVLIAPMKNFRTICAYFILQDGKLKIDWPASVGLCLPDKKTLLEPGVIRKGTLRAMVSRGNYFLYPFVERYWVCWKIDCPWLSDMPLWAYTARNTRQTNEMNRWLGESKTGRVRLLLTVDRPEKARANQFEIMESRPDWLTPLQGEEK